MSGKGSRARRVEAVKRARADVYANDGGAMVVAPFGNERQDRIYARAYESTRAHYWQMEGLIAELREVYGGGIRYTITDKGREMLDKPGFGGC